MTPSPRGLTNGAPVIAAIAGIVVLTVLGALGGRADVIACAVPVALWAVLALARRETDAEPRLTVETSARDESTRASTVIRARCQAEATQVHVSFPSGRSREAVIPGGDTSITVITPLHHSGPAILWEGRARGLSIDGARVTRIAGPIRAAWNAMPPRVSLDALPLAARLPGLDGAHDGTRPGNGGDFRDIHPFAPGDESRRIDWRATARLARRPGDLFVRRTLSSSDASFVVIIDGADDLSGTVATWGTHEPDRTGVTSLDHAREGARSIAEAAVDRGDRIAYVELAIAGRLVRSGGGRRHLAHVLAAIAATGPRSETERYERTPHVPASSTVVILSTFFDGDAARLALVFRAMGHRVVAVDTLPPADMARLSREQSTAARVVFAERREVFRDLAGAGADVVTWSERPGETAARLRTLARERGR